MEIKDWTISELENQLLLLGLNGMAYSEQWNEYAKELNKKKLEVKK